MRKRIIHGISLALLLSLPGCGKFTEIDPKGKNLLGTVTDLDQLLNYPFAGNELLDIAALPVLAGDLFPYRVNVPDAITAPVKTLAAVSLTWDEREDRAAITPSDQAYETFYSIIGKVANPVLLMVDAATGDRDVARRLKAEALVLRAYFHYLAVNVYARAYDPATAATDGGVPYAREHDLLSEPNRKYSVQEVYDLILADLQAARDLNSLPDRPANPTRVGKAFALAVEAKARLSTRDFPGAAAAASDALAIQDALEDHRDNLAPGFDMLQAPGTYFHRPEMQGPEELFHAGYTYLMINALTPGLSAAFEPGSIFYNSVAKANSYGPMYYGLTGIDVLFSNTVYLNPAGLTTVDMYLALAECRVRSGDVGEAMEILNKIRQKRVDPYSPLPTTNAADAFALLKRITRTETWSGPGHFISLKRWNAEAAYRETLRKTLLGVDYELSPASPLWIFPFPLNATGYNANLTQNYE
jgi:hypothetical protein